MRTALEVCGEFLSHIGALEEANAIAEILHKIGVELSDTSPFRWRALLAAICKELDAEPMDIVFLFERLLQLDVMMLPDVSHALFGSPLFLHVRHYQLIVVERFAVAFEGLDAELFKLESNEMCHAEGIYETCVLLRDKIEKCGRSENNSGLTTFLETFQKIFDHDEPKECWDAFYEQHRLNSFAFRRDMKRALVMIESVTLGPTKLELAFPTQADNGPKKIVPRALLENKFGGTRREWRDLSQINTIAGGDVGLVIDDERAQRQEQEVQTLASSVNGETTASVRFDNSNEAPSPGQPVTSRPPRAAEIGRGIRQEGRRTTSRTRMSSEDGDAIESPSMSLGIPGRRKRVRWSAEEEAALIEGYRLYESYSNVWMLIKAKFPNALRNRSNVDLKDKYRNLLRYGRVPQITSSHNNNDNAGVTDNDGTDDNADAGALQSDTTDA